MMLRAPPPLTIGLQFWNIHVCQAIPYKPAPVNPVPRTYVRGFGALPLQGGRNIHPRAYARGVLSFDLEALDRWYGVKARPGIGAHLLTRTSRRRILWHILKLGNCNSGRAERGGTFRKEVLQAHLISTHGTKTLELKAPRRVALRWLRGIDHDLSDISLLLTLTF